MSDTVIKMNSISKKIRNTVILNYWTKWCWKIYNYENYYVISKRNTGSIRIV